MNTKVEVGLSCEINGGGNSELIPPSTCTLTMHTGETVTAIWPEIRDLVGKAAAWGRDEYVAEDVLVAIFAEKMQAWVFREEGQVILVCVTELIQFPRKKVCNIYALAGHSMEKMWKMFFPTALPWLWENGVQEVQATCRTEVALKVRHFGFTDYVHTLKLELKDLS